MIRIYIVEDHEMYLEGLTLLLEKYPGFSVAGSSQNGKHFLEALPALDEDIILLLDVHLPDTEPEELMIRVREVKPKMKIIFLTLMRGTRFIHKLMKYNIQGYILKSASIEELLEAVRIVHEGGTFYSKDIDINIKEDDARNTIIIDSRKIDDILTRREQEILQLICKEFSNSEIADRLFLSVGTVETHRKRIISKLGVNNTVGLVKFAIRHGLIND
ncbi:response regulator transcription factor [Pollutibacter soli]|uniref:response regulator transcription factor n=1 Tax=Pollutibacter soli TaxID=3034157 RepID=UPI0030135B8A